MLLATTDRDFRRLEYKIDALLKQGGVILRHEDFLTHMEIELTTSVADIKAQTDSLLTEVQSETNAVAAVTTLVNGLKAQVDDLTQQLKDAIANGADPATLQAIADNLTAATQAVDANAAAEAALANTAPALGTTPAPGTTTAPTTGALPVIAQISPNAGMAAGGQTVNINGTNLGSVTAVTFGGVPATGIVPDHDSSLQVTTPPGSGTVDVVVTTPAGDSDPVPFTFA